jgi:hypothetical protein
MDPNSLKDSVTRIAELYDLTNIIEVKPSVRVPAGESRFTAKFAYSDESVAVVEFMLDTKKVGVKVTGNGVHSAKQYYLKAHEKFTIYELILLATGGALYRFEDYLLTGETKVA